jgi:DNA-directed RNA polymerase subunit M/transcription elongation factor TFIIS
VGGCCLHGWQTSDSGSARGVGTGCCSGLLDGQYSKPAGAPYAGQLVASAQLPCTTISHHTPLLLPPPPLPLRQDVRSDPTLPRTRDVRCPTCAHNEAVFFTASTEEGMTLFFSCSSCGHRWRDYV